jgi:hypothetical protein
VLLGQQASLRHRVEPSSLLALAQSIQSDEHVTDEAHQSIRIFTTSEMDWLVTLSRPAAQCRAAKNEALPTLPLSEAEPGDVAIHPTVPNWDVRIVAGASGNTISLVKLSRQRNGRIEYRAENLRLTRLNPYRLASP